MCSHILNGSDSIDLEHDNFRLALNYLIKTGDAEWGLRLGAALFHFWETREYLAEGRDAITPSAGSGRNSESAEVRARLLFAAAVLAGEQGDYASARQRFEDSLEICLELNDNRGVAVALNALAVNARDRGELPRHACCSNAVWRYGRTWATPGTSPARSATSPT